MQKTREKLLYDRAAAGRRLKKWRTDLHWTKKEAAQRCGLTEKYYSDIERGSCGMSVETLISLSELHGFTTDYLLHGEKEEGISPGIRELFLANLGRLSPERQNYCLQMLFLFIEGTSVENGSAEAE